MKAKFFVIPAVLALSGTMAFAQAQSNTQRSGTSGVPGVEVNVNNRNSDARGVPGVEANIGRPGDQNNIDTRTSGAAGSTANRDTRGVPGVEANIGRPGDQNNVDVNANSNMRTARADRN